MQKCASTELYICIRIYTLHYNILGLLLLLFIIFALSRGRNTLYVASTVAPPGSALSPSAPRVS
jgi:hypothetical protein